MSLKDNITNLQNTISSLQTKASGVYEAGYQAGKAEAGGVIIDPDKIIEKTVSGNTIRVDDVSEIPHKCTVAVDKDANVTVCGKNLIDPTEYMKSSYNTTLDGDVFTTTFTSGGQYVNRWASAKTHPAGTYTVSVIPVNGDAYLTVIVYNHATDEIINRLYTTDGYNLTFTASVPCRITICGLNGYHGTYSYKLQLEVSTTATAYEPYIEPTTHNITTGQTVKVDSICPSMYLFADNDATITFSYHKSWGMQTEYDRFWDVFQHNGNRTNYSYAFLGYSFGAENFYPKYDMRPVGNATQMFYSWAKNHNPGNNLDLSERLEQCGVVLDTSEVTNAHYLFGNCSKFTRIPPVDLRNATNTKWAFWGCSNLVTIDKITTSETTGIETDLFGDCGELENVTFDGVILKNISFYQCPKLSNTSVQSIIDHLKDLTGTTAQTLTFHADVGAKLTEAQKATITARNWQLVY